MSSGVTVRLSRREVGAWAWGHLWDIARVCFWLLAVPLLTALIGFAIHAILGDGELRDVPKAAGALAVTLVVCSGISAALLGGYSVLSAATAQVRLEPDGARFSRFGRGRQISSGPTTIVARKSSGAAVDLVAPASLVFFDSRHRRRAVWKSYALSPERVQQVLDHVDATEVPPIERRTHGRDHPYRRELLSRLERDRWFQYAVIGTGIALLALAIWWAETVTDEHPETEAVIERFEAASVDPTWPTPRREGGFGTGHASNTWSRSLFIDRAFRSTQEFEAWWADLPAAEGEPPSFCGPWSEGWLICEATLTYEQAAVTVEYTFVVGTRGEDPELQITTTAPIIDD